MHLDVTAPDNWEHLVDAVVDAFGHIDVLYNSAGIIALAHDDANTPREVWERVITVNRPARSWACARWHR